MRYMEPRIQYAKTSDGVNIAYAVFGEGPPVVFLPPPPFSHLQFEWQIPAVRELYERAARRHRHVRYDPRGCGLSDRDISDFSVEAMVRDLEAVADHLGLDRFLLIATDGAAPIAVTYATRHPERLTHLVLWCGWARGSDGLAARTEPMLEMAEKDWEFVSEALTRWGFAWEEGQPGRETAQLLRESVTPATWVAFWRQMRQWDVSHLLSSISVPTLVGHRRGLAWVGVDVARRMAAAIPDARLVLLEGTMVVMGPDADTAIASFLRETAGRARREQELPSGTAAILFADIVDSTALTERLGDAAFRAKARDLDGTLRALVREHAGTPIEGKLLGDGVLATFTSARQAI